MKVGTPVSPGSGRLSLRPGVLAGGWTCKFLQVQEQPGLHTGFEVSLKYIVRPCQEKQGFNVKL